MRRRRQWGGAEDALASGGRVGHGVAADDGRDDVAPAEVKIQIKVKVEKKL